MHVTLQWFHISQGKCVMVLLFATPSDVPPCFILLQQLA